MQTLQDSQRSFSRTVIVGMGCGHLDCTIQEVELADVSICDGARLRVGGRFEQPGSVQLSFQLGHGLGVRCQEIPATSSLVLSALRSAQEQTRIEHSQQEERQQAHWGSKKIR